MANLFLISRSMVNNFSWAKSLALNNQEKQLEGRAWPGSGAVASLEMGLDFQSERRPPVVPSMDSKFLKAEGRDIATNLSLEALPSTEPRVSLRIAPLWMLLVDRPLCLEITSDTLFFF